MNELVTVLSVITIIFIAAMTVIYKRHCDVSELIIMAIIYLITAIITVSSFNLYLRHISELTS